MENKPKGNHQPSQTSYVYCISSMNASGMHLAATHSKACEGRWLPDGRSSVVRALRQDYFSYYSLTRVIVAVFDHARGLLLVPHSEIRVIQM